MKRFLLSDSFSAVDVLALYFFVAPAIEAVHDRYGLAFALLAALILGVACSRTSAWLQRKAGIRTITLGGDL